LGLSTNVLPPQSGGGTLVNKRINDRRRGERRL